MRYTILLRIDDDLDVEPLAVIRDATAGQLLQLVNTYEPNDDAALRTIDIDTDEAIP